jgi:hypothetical protein
MLLHELAHGMAAIWSGARSAVITICEEEAQCRPRWPFRPEWNRHELPTIIGGRAYVVEGMDTSIDDAQIAGSDPAVVANIEAHLVPLVRAHLASYSEADLADMLSEIRMHGALELTPATVQ